jgi:hypothetical protein
MPQAQDDHIPRLLSRIQSKEWFEKTNTPHEGYILSAALTSHHAWYLSDQGVCTQL